MLGNILTYHFILYVFIQDFDVNFVYVSFKSPCFGFYYFGV